MIELLYPLQDKEISLLTPVQREFIMNEKNGIHECKEKNGTGNKCPYDWLFERYANNWGRAQRSDPNELVLSAPEFVKFSWKADIPSHIEVFYAEDKTYPRDPESCETDYIYTCDGITTACMCNFMMNTRYGWKVVADDDSQESEIRYFSTKDEFPRTLYVQGTANVRDMGGAETYDGKRLRQGRIYRGAELESSVDLQYLISNRGARTLHDVLKIKSEMDLRADAVGVHTESNIGDDITFKVFPTAGYASFFEVDKYEERAKQARDIFEFLADENNYPVYMHCTAGADRTGTIAYLIQNLCEVKMEQRILDYNITSLSLMDLRYQSKRLFFFDGFFTDDELKSDDETMSRIAKEKTEKFLIEKCGVKPESIEKIRRIMLE